MKVTKVVVGTVLGDIKTTHTLGFVIEERVISHAYTVYGTLTPHEVNDAVRMRLFRDELSKKKGVLGVMAESFTVSYAPAVGTGSAENAGAQVMSAGNYAFEMALRAEESAPNQDNP